MGRLDINGSNFLISIHYRIRVNSNSNFSSNETHSTKLRENSGLLIQVGSQLAIVEIITFKKAILKRHVLFIHYLSRYFLLFRTRP